MSGHDFIRPGQVDPELLPPDACVRCGEPAASSGHLHWQAAHADDEQLVEKRLDEQGMSPGEAAELVEEWRGRLGQFCAALQQHGFRVHRSGLSVRIEAPGPEPASDAPDLWLGSSL